MKNKRNKFHQDLKSRRNQIKMTAVAVDAKFVCLTDITRNWRNTKRSLWIGKINMEIFLKMTKNMKINPLKMRAENENGVLSTRL